MANGDTTFPKIADTNWWKLRDLFKKKVPTLVTPSYLSSALSMNETSAKTNLLAPFKKIGILDSDGKPTDLAYDWRDDSKYKAVCEKLIQDLYPTEIHDLFHSPDIEPQQLTSWFMNSARCGEPAAKMFSRFYLLLLKADINESSNNVKTGNNNNTNKKETKPKTSKKETNIKSTKVNETAAIQEYQREHLKDVKTVKKRVAH
jgi:hypothetical protein